MARTPKIGLTEQLLTDVIDNCGSPVTPFGDISKVCTITISVVFLIELSFDEHPGGSFMNTKLNLVGVN